MVRACVLVAVVLGPVAGCSRQAKLEKLCDRVEALACDPEILGFSAADRMTVVASRLSEESSVYGELFNAAGTAAPPERKAAFVKAMGDGLGQPWSCPAFDGLWDAQDPVCVKH